MIRRVIIGTSTLRHFIIKPFQFFYSTSRLTGNYQDSFINTNQFMKSKQQKNELQIYEQYLMKHNKSLKKPHEKLRSQQERIINKYIQQQQYCFIINFLLNNVSRRLCHPLTVITIDKWLAKNYNLLSEKDRIKSAYALISFRQNRLFKLFIKQIEKKLQSAKIDKLDIEELIVYLYGQLIINKNFQFLKNLPWAKQKAQKQVLQTVYSCLFYRQYKGAFIQSHSNLISYLQLLLNPALNKTQRVRVNENKQRSHLQLQVQSFLQALGYEAHRQRTVNNFKIDFIIEKKLETTTKKIALEVNGNYHYTLGGKLKGRQILRNLIINQCMPLRIFHQQQFLLSKGYRNKMAYIEQLLDLDEINWQCTNKGVDGSWQLTVPDELLAEFKPK